MNIYSIEEIVKATNNLLKPESKNIIKKNNTTKKTKIPTDTENIINEAEKALLLLKKNNQNIEIPLVLKNEISINNEINSINYKIKIKPEIKDRMINELYVYLKKKIKKNTLKLIIDEQVEIKNLRNKINFLIQNENRLKNNYQILKDNYKLALENNEKLKINNNFLQNNLNQVATNKEQLDIENKELKINLKEAKLNLEESLGKNRSFEINNSELKNTISRYITNYKKLQEKIKLLEKSKNLKSEDETKKIKFYQDENVRLSSTLLSAQKKNESIKVNLDHVQLEKQKISNKIQELNKSIEGKSNIVTSSFVQETPVDVKKDITNLNDIEQKSLDEVINRIFAKI
jgi:hypothetical protein